MASAAVVGALLVGGGVGAVQLVGARSPEPVEITPLATTASPQTTSAAPTPTKTPQRASRGNARGAQQSPSPTPTPSPKTTKTEVVTDTGTCGASFYDEPQGTANGETFDPEALTAAHKTWAFDTRVRVTNPDNGKSVVVRINDRGPYIDGRCIDLSRAAFRAIASLDLGHVDVRYEILK